MYYYLGKVYAFWKVATSRVWWKPPEFEDGERLKRKFAMKLLYRMKKSDYWRKHQTQLECGCYTVDGHFTSYSWNCSKHGLFKELDG